MLVIATGQESQDERFEEYPWPLTRDDLAELRALGLTEESFESYFDEISPEVRRFRASYRRTMSPRLGTGQARQSEDW